LLKARFACLVSGLPAIADDSGFEIDALGGAPGVRSARWSGDNATDSSNNQMLLRELKGVPDEKRGARYVCVMVYLRSPEDPTPIVAQAIWRGTILHNPKGSGGFGYDPLFYVPDQKMSAAEMDAGLKNRLSHRGKAAKHLYSLLHDAAGPL
ncbi:MAG TPA: non-canonical purine NTP pyrophosphatase, partial [Nevskiaceae bacterium]|nr:non-canonical purine NTP pyrophosphatase [Nevskiaceae bacterium]